MLEESGDKWPGQGGGRRETSGCTTPAASNSVQSLFQPVLPPSLAAHALRPMAIVRLLGPAWPPSCPFIAHTST